MVEGFDLKNSGIDSTNDGADIFTKGLNTLRCCCNEFLFLGW